jgi:hypothetical protein
MKSKTAPEGKANRQIRKYENVQILKFDHPAHYREYAQCGICTFSHWYIGKLVFPFHVQHTGPGDRAGALLLLPVEAFKKYQACST